MTAKKYLLYALLVAVGILLGGGGMFAGYPVIVPQDNTLDSTRTRVEVRIDTIRVIDSVIKTITVTKHKIDTVYTEKVGKIENASSITVIDSAFGDIVSAKD